MNKRLTPIVIESSMRCKTVLTQAAVATMDLESGVEYCSGNPAADHSRLRSVISNERIGP